MRNKNYTSEELIKKLLEEKKSLKRTPTAKDMNVASKEGRAPAARVYQYHFHTFNHALLIAGLKVNRIYKYKKEKLLFDLQKVYTILKRLPTTKELSGFQKRGLMAERTVYLDIFGTMKKAYEAAGIDMVAERKNWEERRRRKLIAQLQKLSSEEKKNLSRAKAFFLYKKRKITNLSTFVEVFGTWVKALEAAGIQPRRRIYSDEELIIILQSEYKFTKQAPTSTYFSEMSKQGLLPSPGTFSYHFKSWKNALVIANTT